MKEAMYFKQQKPLTVKILGSVLVLFAVYISVYGMPPFSQTVTMLVLGTLLSGYSISYEIRPDFKNMRHYKLFGITVFRQRLAIIFPDYITIFSARFKKSSEWGPIAAMGKTSDSYTYVIRFFKGNRHFTVFKAKSFELASTKGEELARLLNVSIKVKR